MAQRLTVAQLLARIDEAERATAAHIAAQDARIAALEHTVRGLQDAQCVIERPSRSEQPSHGQPVRIVRMGGIDCYKIRDPRTNVVTYRPVA